KVLDTVRKSGKPLSPSEIAEIIESNAGAVSKQCRKLVTRGLLRSDEYGKYCDPCTPSVRT
ncbi:MarR family transcriptional regulator, partial [Calditrichota bacterium]